MNNLLAMFLLNSNSFMDNFNTYYNVLENTYSFFKNWNGRQSYEIL
jgi:hypothetical protein